MVLDSAKTLKKSSSSSSSSKPSKFPINDLPDSVLRKILTHLPCRNAIQCNLVCKQWYSLISNRFFLMHSIHNNHHRDPLPHCFNFVPELNPLDTNTNFLDTHDSEIRILKTTSPVVAYFNDLILYHQNSNPSSSTPFHVYCIFNPLTEQSLMLPPAPRCHGEPMVGFICYPHNCNKIQECVTNAQYRYKVVQIPRLSGKSNRWKVNIYCSETTQWSESIVSSPKELTGSSWSTRIVAYNGILHWVNKSFIDSHIIAYDPLNDINKFRIIDLPGITDFLSAVIPNPPAEFVIGVCEGSLRVSLVGGILFVWELEDYYNGSGAWRMKHGIQNLPRMESEDESLVAQASRCVSLYGKMVGFHPFDGDIVYLKFTGRLMSYNMKTRTLQVVSKLQVMGRDVVVRGNVILLVQQWWPTPVPPLPAHPHQYV